jgi:hypothetical protein
MRKSLWLNERKKINQVLSRAISEKLSFGIKIPNTPAVRTFPLKLHEHSAKTYLLLSSPSLPIRKGGKYAAFFKLPGYPLLYFNWLDFRLSRQWLAIAIPDVLYKIQLRQEERFVAPLGSIITFFTPTKQRLSLCRLTDVSNNGAKIEGTPVYPLKKNDTIGPCTISLSEYQALIVREVTISASRVVWVDKAPEGKIKAGLRFEPTRNEQIKVASHLEFLTEQSPFPFKSVPSPFS